MTDTPEVRVSIKDPTGEWWEPNPDVAMVYALRACAAPPTLRTIGREGRGRIRQALGELDAALNRQSIPSPREGDRLISQLTPDALLVIDASLCIVLITPERRITVGNVRHWADTLDTARTMARVYFDNPPG
jgi:hypothetical protein